jgi:tRNA(adenine34) deaminase
MYTENQSIHEKHMRTALEEAEIARAAGDWAIGSVITLNGEVVARGRNKVYSKHNKLCHAEVDAINALQDEHFDTWNKDLTIYTTLEPCPMCFGAILMAGIRTIVAGTNFDDSGSSSYMGHLPTFFQQPHFKTTMTTGVLGKECAAMWLSGAPASALLKRGFTPDRALDSSNNQITTYTTTTSNKYTTVSPAEAQKKADSI